MKRLKRHGIALCMVLVSTVFAVGCGDDEESSSSNAATTSNGTSATSNGTTATSNGTTATSNGTTATSNGTTATSNGTTATSNGTTATSNGTTASTDLDFAVLVQGTLFTDDLAEAQELHDPLAAGGEEPAKAAGDFAHYALVGAPILGTQENAFMALDRWAMADGIEAFYSNPDFVAAFGMLFASQPEQGVFVRKSDWSGWGALDSGRDDGEYWFVVARGRLASDDININREAHNAIASAGEAPAMMAGDIAHVALIGLADPREFLAIDIWSDDTNIEAFYSNPDLQAGFGMLFEGDASISVYRSTDWHQW